MVCIPKPLDTQYLRFRYVHIMLDIASKTSLYTYTHHICITSWMFYFKISTNFLNVKTEHYIYCSLPCRKTLCRVLHIFFRAKQCGNNFVPFTYKINKTQSSISVLRTCWNEVIEFIILSCPETPSSPLNAFKVQIRQDDISS